MRIRFDHRPQRSIDVFTFAIRSFPIDALRSSASVALLGTVVLIASLTLVTLWRVHSAADALQADLIRLAQTEADAAEPKRISARVRSMRGLIAELIVARRSGDDAADELARLGNLIPPGAWIAALRRDGTSFIVDGGAKRVDTVSAEILSLATGHARAELISLIDAGITATISDVRYTVRIDER
jgi:Tfp pilus assembly protein PilN